MGIPPVSLSKTSAATLPGAWPRFDNKRVRGDGVRSFWEPGVGGPVRDAVWMTVGDCCWRQGSDGLVPAVPGGWFGRIGEGTSVLPGVVGYPGAGYRGIPRGGTGVSAESEARRFRAVEAGCQRG